MESEDSTGHQETLHAEEVAGEVGAEGEIARPDVVIRIVYSLLFGIVIGVLESLLLVIVAFQLIYSLVTQKLPSPRLQSFANGLVAYFRQILRYLTHNDSVIPFPFSDMPEPLEPTKPPYEPADPVPAESDF